MEAIILAGGFGTRLHSLVADVPKAMAPINGRPFLEFLLDILVRNNFTKVILSVHYKSDVIIKYFANKYKSLEIEYANENFPLGTGGAIKNSLRLVSENYAFVFNGDTFLNFDIFAINEMWQIYKLPIIVLKKHTDASRYNSVSINENYITALSKPIQSNGKFLINTGCYVLPKNCFDGFDYGKSFSFEIDYLNEAVQKLNFKYFIEDTFFIDIGTPADYLHACKILNGSFVNDNQ
jgi:D-glycero-alpha-D-manno-heptose 1-phosphate guanylyltransferase